MKALWRNQSIFDPSEVPYTGLKGVVEQDPLFYIHTSTKQPPAIGLSIEAVLQAASALGVQPDLPPGPSDVSNGRPAPRPEASVATPVARHTHTGAVDPILPAPGYYPTYLDGGNNVLQGVSLNQMLKTAEEVFEPLASLEGFTLCEVSLCRSSPNSSSRRFSRDYVSGGMWHLLGDWQSCTCSLGNRRWLVFFCIACCLDDLCTAFLFGLLPH